MSLENPWFNKKRYGYGWGIPNSWQGWVTLLIYIALTMVTTAILPPNTGLLFVGFYTLVLIIVVVKTSGKPSWNWDEKEEANNSNNSK